MNIISYSRNMEINNLIITHIGTKKISDIPPHKLYKVIKNRLKYLRRKKKALFKTLNIV